jgi:pyroglutamyl-peptidase
MTLPPRVLVTGFEPFGGESCNASIEVARALEGESIGGAHIVVAELPCVFGGAFAALEAALQRWQPVLVVALGQAAGRGEISVERIAVNLRDARIADNAGAQPVDVPVVAGGPAAHFSSLPVKAIVLALREAGIPAGLSMSAGSYVCNDVFYALQHRLRALPGVRGGFIHLPLLPQQQAAQQAGAPSLALESMVAGIRLAIATALRLHDDVHEPGGSIA